MTGRGEKNKKQIRGSWKKGVSNHIEVPPLPLTSQGINDNNQDLTGSDTMLKNSNNWDNE